MVHDLKIDQKFFAPVEKGIKTFEIRCNDRDFKVGDRICLKEINDEREFTGNQIEAEITYLTNYEQRQNYVVFSFKKV